MKLLVAILTSVTLTFRYPCWQPDTLGECVEGAYQIPERLSHMILRDEGGTELYRRMIDGHECRWDTLTITWDGSPIQRFITVTDLAGNESCRRGRALGQWETGVPDGTRVYVERKFFDVSGRLVYPWEMKPRMPYFERLMTPDGKRVRKLVIVK